MYSAFLFCTNLNNFLVEYYLKCNVPMKITRIVLKKFKPFKVPDIDVLDYTIKEAMQVVLGTNGSGKSKLFGQLSPLPSDAKLFRPGGGEEVYLEHNGMEYRLVTDVDSTGKASYSFFNVTEDKEYNDGYKITVQKQLVESVFGYTDKIHEILTGKVNFAGMSTVKRKELLLKASSVDLTYVLKVYDEAHRRHRDIIGAYKHIDARVKDLGSKLITNDERRALEERQKSILSQIDKLRVYSGSLGPNLSFNINLIEQQILECDIDTKRALGNIQCGDKPLDLPNLAGSIEFDRSKLAEINNTISETRKKADRAFELSMRLDNVPDDIKTSDINKTLEDIVASKEFHESSLSEELKNEIYDTRRIFAFRSSLAALTASHNLPKPLMTSSELSEFSSVRRRNADKLTQLETILNSRRKHLEEARNASLSNVTCSKCGHENHSTEYSSKAHISIIEKEVSDTEILLEKAREEIAQDLIDKYNETIYIGDAVNMLCKSVLTGDELTLILNVLNPSTEPFPLRIINDIALVMNVTLLAIEDHKHTEAIRELECKLAQIREYTEFSNLGVVEQAQRLEQKLNDCMDTKRELEITIEKKTSQYLNGKDISDAYRNIIDLEKQYIDWYDGMVKQDIHSRVSSMLVYLESQAATIANTLYDVKHSHAVLDSAKDELLELGQRRKNLDILVRSLSPTTGLIGNVLRELLEDFCENVNEILEELWGYDIELIPYGNDHKLDFKLPVKIIDEEIPDISEGSDGQQGLINFAICLCLMDYLGITGYPVFMDEVGSAFDVSHSENLIRFTNNMVESGRAEQLFMISHHINQYGSQVNADFVVISEEGVILPEVYNKNVIIA